LDSLSRTVLYLWLGVFSVFAFLSYQALVFVPGILLVTLGHLTWSEAPRNGKRCLWNRWGDVVAIALCGFTVAVVNYFVFIKPNRQPLLDIFWHTDFFYGNEIWELLAFYTSRFLDLAAFLFFSKLYPGQYVVEIIICSIFLVGLGALFACGVIADRKQFNQALFVSMPIISANALNLVGLYPLGTSRLTLFLAPVVIVLFVYGLQSISHGLSIVVSAPSQRKEVRDALGAASLTLLVLLLCSYTSVKGASPLLRSPPLEDAGLAVRYLSENVQPNDLLYVHASMREQFKLYSRLTPILSTKVVWGNIGWPCCPRDISVDRLGESDDILPAEMARLEVTGENNSVWLLFSDRPGYWRRSGRRGPGIFEPWLKGAGCLHSELVPLRGVRIDKYQCNGTGAKDSQPSLANEVRQLDTSFAAGSRSSRSG
jgi:hypothetical protein